MKKKLFSDDNLNRAIKILAIILLVLAVFFMATQFKDLWTWITDAVRAVLVPVALAYLIALILFPLIRYLEKKGIGPRWLSLAIVFILAVGLVFGTFFFLTPLLIDEINGFFTDDWNKIIQYITVDLRTDFILGEDIYDQIAAYLADTEILTNLVSGLVPSIIAAVTNILMPIVTTVAILPMLLIFYLLDYEMIGEKLRSLVPQKHEKAAADLGGRLNVTVGNYLRGQLILMIAIGVVATIVYKLIGLDYFLLFGLLVGVCNIIPYFGSIMSAIPPIIYAFIAGTGANPGPGPLIVLAVNMGLQTLEGNIFQPIIMGKQLQMHPLVIIISILFFGSLFGAIGVIFASPISASIRVFVEFFKERRQLREAREAAEKAVAP